MLSTCSEYNFGQADDGMQAQRHYTSKRTDADRDHEDDGHNQRFDRTQGVQEGAGDIVDDQTNGQRLLGACESSQQQPQRSTDNHRTP
jgi:hypothetical protein